MDTCLPFLTCFHRVSSRLFHVPRCHLQALPCATGKPVNPHNDCGLQPSWWKGGDSTISRAFVRGLYEYNHYMQVPQEKGGVRLGWVGVFFSPLKLNLWIFCVISFLIPKQLGDPVPNLT